MGGFQSKAPDSPDRFPINAEQLFYLEDRTVEDIRDYARATTHPELPHAYYCTPLDFISRRDLHFAKHWAYYSELTHMPRVPVFNRSMSNTPWDRFPSACRSMFGSFKRGEKPIVPLPSFVSRASTTNNGSASSTGDTADKASQVRQSATPEPRRA
ncbi:hypothetical protein PspLS_01653 [Pyricularia sp. CBS 133598]|nr:hypothetical protein PspLS_01653 [Pyricularia sp. CBS 133598]